MGSCLDRSRARQVNGFIGQLTHGEKGINKVVYRIYLLNPGLSAPVSVHNAFLIFGRIHPLSIFGKVNYTIDIQSSLSTTLDIEKDACTVNASVAIKVAIRGVFMQLVTNCRLQVQSAITTWTLRTHFLKSKASSSYCLYSHKTCLRPCLRPLPPLRPLLPCSGQTDMAM